MERRRNISRLWLYGLLVLGAPAVLATIGLLAHLRHPAEGAGFYYAALATLPFWACLAVIHWVLGAVHRRCTDPRGDLTAGKHAAQP